MSAASRWPAIATLLARRRAITWGGAIGMALVLAWIGWRLAWPELYLLALVTGAALHFVLRVAIEVVSLVAETLMPQ